MLLITIATIYHFVVLQYNFKKHNSSKSLHVSQKYEGV